MIKFLIIIIKKTNNLKLKSWTVFNLYLTSTTVRLLSLSLDNRIKNNIKKKIINILNKIPRKIIDSHFYEGFGIQASLSGCS